MVAQICMFPILPLDPFKQLIPAPCVSLLVTGLEPKAVTSTRFQDSLNLLLNKKFHHQLSFLCKVSLQKTPLLSDRVSKPLLHFELQKQLILDIHHVCLAFESAALRHSWSVFLKLLVE